MGDGTGGTRGEVDGPPRRDGGRGVARRSRAEHDLAGGAAIAEDDVRERQARARERVMPLGAGERDRERPSA